MKLTKQVIIQIAELCLFCLALGLLVPPVPSDDEVVYRLAPTMIFGGGAFAISLILATRRKAEHWLSATFKMLFYFLLAWIIHHRVFELR